jgi:hypothetical protein
MDHQIHTAAEETAIIVVNALRTHTSLCIPGATDAGHPIQLTPQPRIPECPRRSARP